MKALRHILKTKTAIACWSLVIFPFLLSAAEVDESKLPPPATNQIDFLRDIKPIFETSCLRCHNPEKAKSNYRLDNRASALKGGEHGADILPGNSAKSPLIHYVASLVEDMEMPPTGKGPQLTPAQIGLLRAWIDQGVVWDAGKPTNSLDFTISPTVGATGVSGDAKKFRELNWQREGVNGGVDFQMFEQPNSDDRILVTGSALRDDYKIELRADRSEFGFIHAGWDQFRKYYDDTGGFYQRFTPPSLSLNRDLYLDVGKAWVDFGLTLPRWPRLVIGYEYDYRQGEEAAADWGAYQPVAGGAERNIRPASNSIHENVHTLKFDLDHELYGVTIEDRFRGEFYSLATARTNFSPGPLSGGASAPQGYYAESINEGTHYFQGANTVRLERKFTDWFLASGGYLYSKLNADSTFNRAIAPLPGSFLNAAQLSVPQISLERESHVVNLNGLIGPFNGFDISTGVESEWTRQRGVGAGSLNSLVPVTVFDPAVLSSDYDQTTVQESIGLRYTKIPYTVLFADGHLEQRTTGQSERFNLNNPFDLNNVDNIDFSQKTDANEELADVRAGFNTSPWQSISLSAHYRYEEHDSHYENGLLLQSSFPSTGYPGFLDSQNLISQEVEAKLVWHPRSFFKTTLTYQYRVTDSWVQTSPLVNSALGNNILAGQENVQTYSINTALTPTRRLFLSTTFSYQPTTMVTSTGTATAVVPYRGSTYTVLADGTYVIDEKTDLFASYAFSTADYGQNNIATGLPLGIQYEQHNIQCGVSRRFNQSVSSRLQYRFNYYAEPTAGGVTDFRAHSIFATVTFRFH